MSVRGRRQRRGVRGRAAAALVILGALAGCANLSGAARPAASTLGCARAAVAGGTTPAMDDKRRHCLGAAQVALLCSVAEARLVSWSKEGADALGAGDADADDVRASLTGIACARRSGERDAIERCCAAAGW